MNIEKKLDKVFYLLEQKNKYYLTDKDTFKHKLNEKQGLKYLEEN